MDVGDEMQVFTLKRNYSGAAEFIDYYICRKRSEVQKYSAEDKVDKCTMFAHCILLKWKVKRYSCVQDRMCS